MTGEHQMDREDFVEVYSRKQRGGPVVFDWRRIHGGNGNILSTSHGQGYVDADFCIEMARRCNAGVQLRRINPRGGFEVIPDPAAVEP